MLGQQIDYWVKPYGWKGRTLYAIMKDNAVIKRDIVTEKEANEYIAKMTVKPDFTHLLLLGGLGYLAWYLYQKKKKEKELYGRR